MFNYSEEKMNINDLIEKLRNQGMIYVIGHSNIEQFHQRFFLKF